MIGSWLPWILIGYVSGSIPFGLLIGLARGMDIRKAGSGNIGATNVGRVLGQKFGVLCLLLDMLKGFVPVLLAGWSMGALGQTHLPPDEALKWLAVAAAAMLGHVFPIWLRFRGGKGVATGLGVLLGVWPLLTWPALIALAVWLALVGGTRYVSLASMVAAASLPVSAMIIAAAQHVPLGRRWPMIAVSAAMAVLVIVRHRANVARLLSGTEPRLGKRS